MLKVCTSRPVASSTSGVFCEDFHLFGHHCRLLFGGVLSVFWCSEYLLTDWLYREHYYSPVGRTRCGVRFDCGDFGWRIGEITVVLNSPYLNFEGGEKTQYSVSRD